MTKLELTMPVQNERSSPLKLLLEPLSEYFVIQPGQKVEVHGVCDDKTANRSFTVAPNDLCLTIYAPGEISGFVDCYVTHQGRRLLPDGN